MLRRFVPCLALLMAGHCWATSALANSFFVDPAGATGTFEWDVFGADPNTPNAGPHAPDVQQSGGAAAITVAGGGIVTGSKSLYSGFGPATNATYTAAVTGASTSSPFTTLALQLGFDAAGNVPTPGSLLLDGVTPPTELVDRGAGSDGTRYFWAQWQTSAATSYAVRFQAGAHVSLRGAQIDYLNSAS
ncbi:MAG TPA: hypothetical protein VEQ85_10075, partial [Lacipirellulaceae bacterium]|nr:hypothetical protein [Lacipirellulaceae bacterium]